MMTVKELIEQLEKVQHKEAPVFLHNTGSIVNELCEAVMECNLKNAEIAVVLK